MTSVESDALLGRRDRKKLETRRALQTAALRLVAERGYDHVTVEDISDACDVSARTFFNYFTSKDEAIIGDRMELGYGLRLLAELPPEIPMLEALRTAFVPVVAQMESAHDAICLLMRVVHDNPQLVAKVLAANAETEQAIADAVVARLGIDPDDSYPWLVAAVFGAAFRVAVTRWAFAADGADTTLGARVDEAFDAVAAGLTPPQRTSPQSPARRSRPAVSSSSKDSR